MPGPYAGAGLGMGLQQAGLSIGQALMQVASQREGRQRYAREQEILQGREARADERLDLAQRDAEANRQWRERQDEIASRERQRANARYVADRIRQEGRYADTLRMQGVETDVVPGIESMPEPQFSGGVGSALMDVTRRHATPEGSMQRVPFTRADPESAMAYAESRNRPAAPSPRLIETEGGYAWATPGRSDVTRLRGARPPAEQPGDPTLRVGGREFPDTPEGRAEALAWKEEYQAAGRQGDDDPIRRFIMGEMDEEDEAPRSPMLDGPRVPGGRATAEAAEAEGANAQREAWDRAAAHIRANPDQYENRSPEDVLGPRP